MNHSPIFRGKPIEPFYGTDGPANDAVSFFQSRMTAGGRVAEPIELTDIRELAQMLGMKPRFHWYRLEVDQNGEAEWSEYFPGADYEEALTEGFDLKYGRGLTFPNHPVPAFAFHAPALPGYGCSICGMAFDSGRECACPDF